MHYALLLPARFEGVKSDIVDRYGHCTMTIDDFNKLLVELSYKPQFGPGAAPLPETRASVEASVGTQSIS